jgi:hypothetical protein
VQCPVVIFSYDRESNEKKVIQASLAVYFLIFFVLHQINTARGMKVVRCMRYEGWGDKCKEEFHGGQFRTASSGKRDHP